ncbi:hypothetical protein Pelo_18778 [Pelomyxa schiedti]|nr:hypothetical protein Pelo_18778 [Pelomyxa schiedti]
MDVAQHPLYARRGRCSGSVDQRVIRRETHTQRGGVDALRFHVSSDGDAVGSGDVCEHPLGHECHEWEHGLGHPEQCHAAADACATTIAAVIIIDPTTRHYRAKPGSQLSVQQQFWSTQ